MSKILSPILGVFGAIGAFVPGLQPLGIVAMAGKIGVDYLTASRQNRTGAAFPPVSYQAPPPPFSATVELPVTPRLWSYGRVPNPGAFFWKEAGSGKTVLTYGLYLCDGPISLLESITCDDELVSWGLADSYISPASSPSTVYCPGSGTKITGYGGTNTPGPIVLVETAQAQLGGNYSYLLGTFQVSGNILAQNTHDSTLSGYWDANHLGKGVTAFYTFAFFGSANGNQVINPNRQKFYPNNWPLYKFTYRGAPVYDPRDPTQSELDPGSGLYSLYNSTWLWSENPALIAADYINRLIQSGQTAITGVNWEAIAEAADDCDRLVPAQIKNFGDGVNPVYEPFARLTANISLETEPRDVLARIMAACDGAYGLDSLGRFQMWIGKTETPNVVFDDSDILAIEESFGPALAEEQNYINITYSEPRQNYSPMHAPIYQDATSIARIGRRVGQPIQLDWCPSPSQAWRMVRRHILRQNRKRTLRVTLRTNGILAMGQRVVGLNCVAFNIVGNYRVARLALGRDLTQWQAELIEIDDEIFKDPAPPSDPLQDFKTVGAPAVPTPTNADVYKVGNAVRIEWSQSQPISNNQYPRTLLLADPNYMWDARYSTNGGDWEQVNIQISQFSVQTPDLTPGASVIVQTRFIAQDGTLGAWSASSSPITI